MDRFRNRPIFYRFQNGPIPRWNDFKMDRLIKGPISKWTDLRPISHLEKAFYSILYFEFT